MTQKDLLKNSHYKSGKDTYGRTYRVGVAYPRRQEKAIVFKTKNTLDIFLERNAISKDQYDKNLGDLIEKMGMKKLVNSSAEKGDVYGKIEK